VFRKDRNLNGGGVFIAIKGGLISAAVPEGDTESEITWARIQLESSQDMYVSSFYRPPSGNLESFKCLGESIGNLPVGAKKKPLIIGGDFNLPDIQWKDECIKQGSNKVAMCEELLNVAANEALTQIQEDPTREGNTLDLCFTNRPGLVKYTQTVPGIGGHDIVVVDQDLRAKINKAKPRKVYHFRDANWEDIRSDAKVLNDKLLDNFSQTGIENSWQHFKTGVIDIMDKHIPSKLTSTRYNLPWLNHTLKKMTRKKKKLYDRARKYGRPKDWSKFKAYKKDSQKT
jgi:hypothetical protein